MLKKSFYSFLIAVLLVSVTSVTSFAQSSSFSGISKIQLKNASPIMEDGQVRGYYIFYRVEKKDRKTVSYKIQFLNENLEKTGSKSITGTPYLSLIEASYNGTNVMLKFLDTREKKYTFRQYDRAGEQVSRKSKEYDRKDIIASTAYSAGNTGNGALFPVNGKGFLNISGKKFKKIGYEINFYPNSKEVRGWTYKSDPEEKATRYAEILGANEDIVLISIASFEGITMKALTNYVVGIDVKTGKEVFETPLSKDELNVIVSDGFIDEEAKEFTIFGTYFGESGDAYKKNGEGLYSVSFDFQGNVLKEKINLWEKDFGKLLPVSKKGKMADLGYFYMHDVFKTADGRIFAFGEQYRKAASGAGIAMNILAGGGRSGISVVKIVVEDMLFFEFTPDFELKKVEFFDKSKSNFSLPEGYGGVKAFKLGQIVDIYGGFDYFYKTENKEENSVSVIYRDWNREEKQSEVHSVTYAGGDFVTDMMPIETEAKRYRLMRGKEGHIIIMEYFKKEKKLNVRMEKFNF